MSAENGMGERQELPGAAVAFGRAPEISYPTVTEKERSRSYWIGNGLFLELGYV